MIIFFLYSEYTMGFDFPALEKKKHTQGNMKERTSSIRTGAWSTLTLTLSPRGARCGHGSSARSWPRPWSSTRLCWKE